MKGELFHKGIIHQEDDYFMIRQSIPYPLAENNAYLIETNTGWSVIDVGIDQPLTREIWEMAVKEVGISFRQIDQIYITHCHPDHLGAARWLQRVCDAPVFIPRAEIERAEEFIFIEKDFPAVYRRAIEPASRRHGFLEGMVRDLIDDWQHEVTPLFKRPYEIFPLDPGDEIELAGEAFKLYPAPGHADGQVVLFHHGSGRLFSADVLAVEAYLHFTDWPNSYLENPLGCFHDSIKLLKDLNITKCYPGHGSCFEDLYRRLDEVWGKHEHKLDKVLKAVDKPVTAGELYPQLNARLAVIEYVHLHRLLLGETLGYLEFLASRGQLIKDDDGEQVRFRPAG